MFAGWLIFNLIDNCFSKRRKTTLNKLQFAVSKKNNDIWFLLGGHFVLLIIPALYWAQV